MKYINCMQSVVVERTQAVLEINNPQTCMYSQSCRTHINPHKAHRYTFTHTHIPPHTPHTKQESLQLQLGVTWVTLLLYHLSSGSVCVAGGN